MASITKTLTLEEARQIVAEDAERKRRLEAAQAVIDADIAEKKTRADENFAKDARERRLAECDRQEAEVFAGFAVLENLKKLLQAEHDALTPRNLSGSERVAAEDKAQHLRETIRQIDQGMTQGEGTDPRLWDAITSPEVSRFNFATPGLPALRARLTKIRAARAAAQEEV